MRGGSRTACPSSISQICVTGVTYAAVQPCYDASMHTLTVYISDDCWSCEETYRILDEVTSQFPTLTVSLVNTRQEPMPDGVFAVPTYVLNGNIISLGNPSRASLAQKLTALFGISSAPVEMDAK
ncbi:MAG: hypothetical protein GY805_16205 [Chloroflexi bacterium]|nr:hypothetical protein [Chloroflexota bacterium]